MSAAVDWANFLAGGTALSEVNLDKLSKRLVISVKDPPYNAAGNGTTDDYAAIKSAVAAINTAGGGVLVFPPGTYKIDQYKITGGGSANGITDVIFQNCNGLLVTGYGAVISVKGNFNRAADASSTLSY